MAVANPHQPANVQPQPPFPTYHTAVDLPSQARLLCEIVETVPIHDLEARLASTQIKPEPETVQQVLKLLYNSPSAAVKFFGWSGLTRKHSEYSWNLMVDLLGKNRLFEPMWDAVRSMKQEGVLSLTTFVSVFGSYCAAGRLGEAVMSFDVMERRNDHLFKDCPNKRPCPWCKHAFVKSFVVAKEANNKGKMFNCCSANCGYWKWVKEDETSGESSSGDNAQRKSVYGMKLQKEMGWSDL